MKEYICLWCKKEFLAYKISKTRNKDRKYCSQKCAGLWGSQNRLGNKSPNWRGGGIGKMCLGCGVKFKVRFSVIKRDNGKYCSKKCSTKAQIGRTPWNKGLKGVQAGAKHPNWKGGISKNPRYKFLNNKKWVIKNRDKKYFYTHKRKMLKNNVNGTHTLEEWLLLKAFYQYMCLCCKKQEPEIVLSEDHVVPLSMGGSDNIDNIQPLCRSCNSIKYTKAIDFRSTIKTSLKRENIC